MLVVDFKQFCNLLVVKVRDRDRQRETSFNPLFLLLTAV